MTDLSVQQKHRREQLQRRKRRNLKKTLGTNERPRLVVYRSNKHIYAQIVNDVLNRTLAGCSSLTPALRDQAKEMKGNIEIGKLVGKYIAAIALAKGIKNVNFDRNGRRYHGRVKAVADGAREAGLSF
ncbi:MAG: 50S ribosomal protein L18 [Calditrichaeota bacterium]|nr:50S ribosomal protein L18 [Calditrichota bacterium]